MEEKKYTNTDKEYYIEACEHQESCFGNYIDSDGKICKDGMYGYCSYCVECRRVCPNMQM